MIKSLIFAKNFLKNPIANASIIPSSKYLAKEMIKGIDFSKVHTIVELGPWTWTFTKTVVESMQPWTTFIAIELEKDYVEILTKTFWNKVVVEHESAHNIDMILEKHGIKHLDLIVSWLGFVSLPKEVLQPMLEKISYYTSQWTIFRTFTYIPKNFEQIFKWLNIKKCWSTLLNFPPATVYGIN